MCIRDRRNSGQRLSLAVILDDSGEINVRHRIAANNDKRFAQQVLRLLDAPRSPQRRLLNGVVDVHAPCLAIPKVVLDVLCHVLERDNHIHDAMTL